MQVSGGMLTSFWVHMGTNAAFFIFLCQTFLMIFLVHNLTGVNKRFRADSNNLFINKKIITRTYVFPASMSWGKMMETWSQCICHPTLLQPWNKTYFTFQHWLILGVFLSWDDINKDDTAYQYRTFCNKTLNLWMILKTTI